MTEVVRWHFLRPRGQADPIATRLDVGLTLASTLVGFLVSPRNKLNNATLRRLGFQTVGILRCIAVWRSCVEQSARWEVANIRLIHVFDYSRWVVAFFVSYKAVPGDFATAVLLGLSFSFFLALWSANYPGGPLVGMTGLFGMIVFSDWLHHFVNPK